MSYLGPVASFSHQAAIEFFGKDADLQPHASFAAIFNALQNPPPSGPHPTHAIVPIENSSNGTVVSLLDLLADPENKYPSVRVCAEYYLAVHHCLLGPSTVSSTTTPSGPALEERLRSIQTLHTHPQVWTQCTRYLSQHLSHAERIDTSSTSAAAAHLTTATSQPTDAAIGSDLAAREFRLEILARNIEDDAGNTTRFLVLTNGTPSPSTTTTAITTGPTKTKPKRKSLLTFTLDHSRPGSLADALQVFGAHRFNLTSIDTRPSRRRVWHYIFCVECEEVAAGEGRVEEVFARLKERTETCRYLGTWEDALHKE